MTAELITKLEQNGFNRWTKGNLDRLYINAAQLGLVCTYYKTGNISSATFRGESISNCKARKMKASKTFIDLKSDTVYSDDAAMAHAAAEMTGLAYTAKEWDTIIKLGSAEEVA